MLKVLKNLKNSWITVLVIVILLCVQAATDLALPDYTSKIVNVGIQYGGIEEAVPELVSKELMENLLLFTETDEQILENYDLVEANPDNHQEKVIKKYLGKEYNVEENNLYVLKDLDEEQLKPVLENAKYSLIIAGAGSGKTLTLIGKIKYMLENQLINPQEICRISFTNEATNNLKKNILKNCHVEVPTFTFHKLALDILKKEHVSYKIARPDLLEFTIQEFFETKCFGNTFLIKKCYKIFDIPFFFSWKKILESAKFPEYKKQILTFVNLFKANGYFEKNLKDILRKAKKEPLLYVIYAIYLLYETDKESSGTLDFDDIILKTTLYLKEHACTLPYKLLIIDEFQDTSLCRFQFVQEILKKTDASLCVVGDDYQSIYHFSGCDLTIFLNFASYFPNVKTYKLETTYRNSDELVKTAGRFIQKNPNQVKKELKSSKHIEKPIKLIYYKNLDSVLERVLEMIPEDKEIFILGRNNFGLKKYTKNLT